MYVSVAHSRSDPVSVSESILSSLIVKLLLLVVGASLYVLVRTLIVIVAALDVSAPESVTVYVNVSVPTKSIFGS